MNNIKQGRISSEINKALMEIIFEDAQDELLKSITITGCEVTNDLSFCKVYFTSLIDMNSNDMEKALNDGTSSFLRSKLSQKIDLRNTPKLIFKYDKSLEYGKKIENIIEEIHEEDK